MLLGRGEWRSGDWDPIWGTGGRAVAGRYEGEAPRS